MRHVLRDVLLWAALAVATPAIAQENPFAPGWTLQPESSAIRFQSVKNETKAETSKFASFSGEIDANGQAAIRILLDSVDTAVDLRNVRMRFLFFETFNFPEARITTTIPASELADLATLRRKTVHLPFALNLHGVSKAYETDVTVTWLDADTVAVSSTVPINVPAADFGLDANVTKLEEAANVAIIPSATVSFDLMFHRNGAGAAPAPAALPAEPAQAALETAGPLDAEACTGRFEIVSRSGNIFFRSGSARLKAESHGILDQLADIITRCPGMVIEVGGHTDDEGSDAANQRLSEQRAQSVARYLAEKGVEAARLRSVGYGESRPVVPNDTWENKARNRRIEFVVVGG